MEVDVQGERLVTTAGRSTELLSSFSFTASQTFEVDYWAHRNRRTEVIDS